jgi:hypothetical protein
MVDIFSLCIFTLAQPNANNQIKPTKPKSYATMTILQQKRKSLHIDIDGFGDSIEADELNLMETAEFPTAGIKSSKSVHFSEIVESHESDKSEEEIEFTWLTVSSSLPWLVAFRFVWCFSQPLTHSFGTLTLPFLSFTEIRDRCHPRFQQRDSISYLGRSSFTGKQQRSLCSRSRAQTS